MFFVQQAIYLRKHLDWKHLTWSTKTTLKVDRRLANVHQGWRGWAFHQFSSLLWCDAALLTYNILSSHFSFQMIKHITAILIVVSRGAKSGRSCEPSSQKIFSHILIWQKTFEENQAINVDYHIKHILNSCYQENFSDGCNFDKMSQIHT